MRGGGRAHSLGVLLAAFASGELPVLLTSRVLNEGVDVPDARVGVVSASGFLVCVSPRDEEMRR